MPSDETPEADADLPRAAQELARRAKMTGPVRLSPLEGAANNRVFRLECGGTRALLKAYFRHPDDPRDRLATEFAFASFAWDHGLRSLPQPLACDREAGLGLYEYIDGRRPTAAEADAEAVAQALQFYRDLNSHRQAPDAASLPDASEACFTLNGHLAAVSTRVERLGRLEDVDETAASARLFAQNELASVWRQAEAEARAAAAARGLSLGDPLPPNERRLSPSDFGFHNALRGVGGRLSFLDFEYAGWDDPARTVCDFFCQPAVPAPRECLSAFACGTAEGLTDLEGYLARVGILMPVYRIKWCCILLNDFLGVGRERRRFARGGASPESRTLQIDKARRLLAEGGAS